MTAIIKAIAIGIGLLATSLLSGCDMDPVIRPSADEPTSYTSYDLKPVTTTTTSNEVEITTTTTTKPE